jgi:hypothetical protein
MMEQANRVMPSPQFTSEISEKNFVTLEENNHSRQYENQSSEFGQELKNEVADAIRDADL